MATLKIGNAHNESGQKFFASNDLTTNSTDLLWKGVRVLTEASFSVSGDFEGTGSADSPLSWKGFKAENAEGTVLSETVKTIKAGTNVTLSAQDGVLTIKSEGGTGSGDIDLSNYSTTSNISLETTGSSTGVTLGSKNGTVSIYSGYDGNGLSIGSTYCHYNGGDVSLSGTLSTSVGNFAAGTTTINATSLTNLKLKIGSNGTASSANTAGGFVVLGSDGKIPTSLYEQTAGGLTSVDTGNAINTGLTGDGTASSPISLDLSNYGTRNAISLTTFGGFTFKIGATTAMSIGTDANVRIAAHTYLAGNSEADVYFHGNATNTANGLVVLGADGKIPTNLYDAGSGGGTEIDWSNVNATEIKLNGSEGIWFNTTMNDIFLKPQNGAGTLFIDAMDIQLNECGLNQPTGLVQLTPEGKIPTELYDAGGGTTIDWSNVSAELIGFSADMEMSLNSPTRITIGGGELLINTRQLNLGEAGGTTINFNLTTLDDLKIYYVNEGTSATPNTAGGFVILDSTGKLPAVDGSKLTNLPAATVDLSNYSAETIKLTGTKKIQIAGGSATSGILDITTGDDGRPALTTPGLWSADIAGYLTTIHGGMQMDIYADSSQADVRIYAGGSPSSGSGNGNILLYGSDIKFNGNALNSANGLVKAEAGKLPALDGSKLTNLPAGTVDLSAYTGGINLSSTDDSAVAIKFNSGNPTYNAELSMSSSGVTLSGYGDVSLEHTGGSYLRLTSGETTLSSNASLTLSAGSRLTISASEGVYLGAAGLNTAGGLVKVGDDGKIPSSILPEQTNIDLSDAVLRYPATVDTESKVVTITDGTPVKDVRIGDEIVTAAGVYKKTKDSITTGSPADGTRIKVSGITSPAVANGLYILTETEKVWKHESANYWISQWISSKESESYWLIANTSSPSYPGVANFTASGSSSSMPWEMSNWSAMSNASGSPVLENASTEQTITDTLALFEYASLPVEPKNIVQSVNGNKPDASGNVTIETSSGGLTSVSVGNGLTGNGTSSSPIKLDLSNAVMEHNCDINAQVHNFSVSLLNEVGISATSVSLTLDSLELTTGPVNIFIQKDGLYIDASQILLNRHNQNAAGGFAIVGEDGKLPVSIIPVSSDRHPFTSSDLASNVLTITTTGNVTGVIDDSGKAWNFADEEVTYTDSTVSVDLSGVFARKGIVTPAGTWKLMLYGA